MAPAQALMAARDDGRERKAVHPASAPRLLWRSGPASRAAEDFGDIGRADADRHVTVGPDCLSRAASP